jgi:hypothetical protein
MPPRFAYWTIILDGKPTAFRARTSEELLPTLRQLQVRQPDAVMRWFARGRLWASPDEERTATQARRSERERRRPEWRPGGEHRDPRDRFKVPREEKRRRFASKLRRERDSGPRTGPPKEDAGGSYPRRRPAGRTSGPAGRGPRGWNRDRGRGRGNGGGGRGGRGGK